MTQQLLQTKEFYQLFSHFQPQLKKNDYWCYSDLSWSKEFLLPSQLDETESLENILKRHEDKIKEILTLNIPTLLFVNGRIVEHPGCLSLADLSSLKVEVEQYENTPSPIVIDDFKNQIELTKQLPHKLPYKKRSQFLTKVFTYQNQLNHALHYKFRVAEGVKLPQIYCLHISDFGEGNKIINSRITWDLKKSSEVNLFEEYFSEKTVPSTTVNNPYLEINLEKESTFNHFVYVHEDLASNFLAEHTTTLKSSSKYHTYSLQKGAKSSTLVKNIIFEEPKAEARLYGLYLTGKNQVMDNIININHKIPDCESEQLYKGVLRENAKVGFTGKVDVARDAQSTLSNQLNNTLILGEDAIMQSRPQLEILADDVKCNHGSTIGRINQEEIFYLMSRGIPFAETQDLLADSFLGEFYTTAKNHFPNIKKLVTH